jgi:hypothetical protein
VVSPQEGAARGISTVASAWPHVIDEPIRVLDDDETFLGEITINPEKNYQTITKPKDPET